MAKEYRSEVLASVHETALGMTEAGVMVKRTMKAFDEMCLAPVAEMSLVLEALPARTGCYYDAALRTCGGVAPEGGDGDETANRDRREYGSVLRLLQALRARLECHADGAQYPWNRCRLLQCRWQDCAHYPG